MYKNNTNNLQHPGIVIGYNRIPIDFELLAQLKNYDIDLDYAEKCIDANK